MCELHLIKSFNRKINTEDLKQFCIALNEGGKTNKDGFGFTNGEKIFKREKQYNPSYNKTIQNMFSESDFILGHNRMSTAGKVKKSNAHPFYNERFIWLHNGHIYNYKQLMIEYNLQDMNVDSEIIGKILILKSGNKTDIIEPLQKTLKEISGSYSVLLFDKLTKRLYYFKNGQDFAFKLISDGKNDILLGNTESQRFGGIYQKKSIKKYGLGILDYKTLCYFIPKDLSIYEISDKIQKIGEFEECTQNYNYTYADFKNITEIDDALTILNNVFGYDINISKILTNNKKKYIIDASGEIAYIIKTQFNIDIQNPLKWKTIKHLCEILRISDFTYNEAYDFYKEDTDDKNNIDKPDYFKAGWQYD